MIMIQSENKLQKIIQGLLFLIFFFTVSKYLRKSSLLTSFILPSSSSIFLRFLGYIFLASDEHVRDTAA